MSTFRLDVVVGSVDNSLPLMLRGRVSPQEFAQFADTVNVHFHAIRELDAEQAKMGCCFAITTVATCGLSVFLGGMCWFFYKLNQIKKSRDAALAKVHEILSGYNRELWSVRGIHMSLRQELAQMPGGNQPQAVFQPFIEVQMLDAATLAATSVPQPGYPAAAAAVMPAPYPAYQAPPMSYAQFGGKSDTM